MTTLESTDLLSHSDENLPVWRSQLNAAPQSRAHVLSERIRKQESVLTDRLVKVYGQNSRVQALVQDLIQAAVQASLARSEDLWQLDLHRQAHPDWHQQGAVGYTAYVDQFAGNLQGITQKIEYLKSLGVTYLHLLPFFKAAAGPNDGGFAVAHFEEVDRAVVAYRAAGFRGVTYVMPQGGVVTPYERNRVNVADWALARGYNYSPRLHVDLWGNGWGK